LRVHIIVPGINEINYSLKRGKVSSQYITTFNLSFSKGRGKIVDYQLTRSQKVAEASQSAKTFARLDP
jgi:hypothetical protein